MLEQKFLIVGLGNPGKQYEKTRHNVGFKIVKALAEKHEISLHVSLLKANGKIGQGKIHGKQTILLLPLTYMNESGVSVKRTKDVYDISKEHLLIISDDVDLPLGTIRLRGKGSCGGHNGLRSIEKHLGSNEYPRVRIGVGKPTDPMELSDYVLGNFTEKEEELLDEVIQKAVEHIELWLEKGAQIAPQTIK